MKVARTDLLIKKARQLSGSQDYGDDYGIDDEPFIISLCDAQIELQAAIVEEDACAFVQYKEIDIEANTESYAIPSNAFINNLVYGVEYSRTGAVRDYEPLDDMMYRSQVCAGFPEEYIVDGGRIYLDQYPVSAQGKLRVRYEAGLDKLDKRRGEVQSVTIGSSYLYPLTIVLDSEADSTALETAEYVCVNDKYGNVRMRNIPIESWDDATSTLTVQSDFVGDADSDLAIEAGNYITIGEDTTTHSKLLYVCEPYLYNVAAWDAQRQHSSTDSEEQNDKLSRLLKRIIAVYAKLPAGKVSIPERRWT